MYSLYKIFGLALILGSLLSCGSETSNEEQFPGSLRIVSLSGAVTEALFALGQGDKIVGIDVTSSYPADQVQQILQLGHVRKLNVEAVLALKPDLIIMDSTDAALPAIAQLEGAGIEILKATAHYDLNRPVQLLEQLAAKLNQEEKAKALIADYKTNLKRLHEITQNMGNRPKVLFIYARGKGSMMVAGNNTPAAAIIEAAGGQNAVTAFDDFKALSAEGLLEVQPDAFLLFDSGLQSLGGVKGLLEVPGVAQTPAGKGKQIIAIDGLKLLGFTPRAAEAAIELAEELQKIPVESTLISTVDE